MPRKKKTDDTTISSEKTVEKKEENTTFSPYGSEALKANAVLKKPTLLGKM